MPDAISGGERSRQDVYGETPTPETAAQIADAEEQLLLEPGRNELEADSLAITAIIEHIHGRADPPTEEVIGRVQRRGLLSLVLDRGEFAIGDNDQTKHFSAIYRRVDALRRAEEQSANTPKSQSNRSTRA